MYFKKAIKYLVYMFCLFFLFSCSTILDDDISIEKTPQEITIIYYKPKVDCSETLDVFCNKDSSEVKTEMQNKSNEKTNNNKIKTHTTSSIVRKSNPIYNARAEKHCKKYDKKAKLATIVDNTGAYGRRYIERYLCIQ
ncbi:hypothetical protein OAX12_02365 [Candidatus Pelagibacter sp.]|nr:hypothetical protein [Candidatus Pelagibacter sp.]